jgi:DNA (cytosine-5)-methyltransferase 1
MRYLSLFSGIEAASAAWHPMGWKCAAVSEIEPFPCAVLAHHYPTVPNLGDITKFKEWPDLGTVDLLVGGSPCQSFSIAGLRKGMDDPRGNLMLTYLAVVNRVAPRWVVYENVPGLLSSNGGRDFGTLLGGLAELGYGFAYRVLDAQYIRVESHSRAVPQRRRRVFVVGYLGDWRRAAAVLFERESLLGHPAPRRQAGKGIAPTLNARTKGGGGLGTDSDCNGGLVARSLRAQSNSSHRADSDNYVVAHSLRGEGFDASEDGTGRGTPFVPVPFDTTQITSAANRSNPKHGDPCHPLSAEGHPLAIAFDCKGDVHSVCLGSDPIHARELAMPQTRRNGDPGVVQYGAAVRRLTPTECERLQGFPDRYTEIKIGKSPAKDGPRYKALGNSMAINTMRWIGDRIELVDSLVLSNPINPATKDNQTKEEV